MKVLFVCSGNKNHGQPGTVVKNQADSVIKQGVEIDFFLISESGFKGYLKSIKPLIKRIKSNNYSVIHSHYSLSAFVTTLALFSLKLKNVNHIVSLMGSDAQLKGWKKKLTRCFNRKKWNYTIVKSELMAKDLGLKNYTVLPNGVDLDKVKPAENLPQNNPKKVLFAANPSRESKNFDLAKTAFDCLNSENTILEVIHGIPHHEMIQHINKSDVVLLTSKWEGSPNIIKEAMACNRPIVSTNVGDVEYLLENVKGSFVVSHQPQEIAQAIQHALAFNYSNGRDKIIQLGLSSNSIAEKIVQLYKKEPI